MAETKLDITGSSAVAQRENDKLTKTVAKLREEVRQLNSTTRESKAATDSWSAGMERIKAANDKWAQGMSNLRRQIGATRADFSVLNSAMQKTVATKDPFEPWTKGLANLKAQNDKWAAGMRVMAAQNMKPAAAGQSFSELYGGALRAEVIDKASESMGSLVSRMVGVGAAVGVVTSGYRAWADQVEKTANAHDDLSLSVVRSLAAAGKLSLGARAEQFSKGVQGATPQQAMATLGGVMQSGETLTDERTFSVAREIAKLAPTGIDLTQTGALSADVADIVGEGVSARNVANLTVGLKQQLRGKTDLFSGPKFQKQIERLKRNTGMSGEDALAYAVVAAQSEGGAEALGVAAMRPGERSYDQRKMFKSVFSPAAIAEAKANLSSYQTQDLAAGELSALGGFQSGREALSQQKVAIEDSKTDQQMGPLTAERRRIAAYARNKAWQKSRFTGAFAEAARPVSALVDFFQGEEGAGIGQINTMRQTGSISAEQAAEMTAALKEAAAASRAAAKSNRVGNVDRHTE